MIPSLVDVTGEFLDLEVVEALMHEQVNTDDFVELIDAEPADCLENTEEYCAEDARPGNNDDTADSLDFEHVKTTRVDQTQVLVEDADC